MHTHKLDNNYTTTNTRSLFCDAHAAGCTNGDIRLVNGTSNRNGRLEVCYNNAWGTICQNRFFAVDAGVACGQLGFSRFSKLQN